MSARVTEVEGLDLSARQQEVLARVGSARGKVLTPYKIWIHAPEVADGMERLGTYLNTASSLTPQELELAILSTGVHWGSSFVIAAHVRHSLRVGLPEAVVQAVVDKRPLPPLEGRLQAVAGFVADALAGGGVDDPRFDAHVTGLGRRAMAELVSLIGYFTSVSIAMRLHGMVPAENGG